MPYFAFELISKAVILFIFNAGILQTAQVKMNLLSPVIFNAPRSESKNTGFFGLRTLRGPSIGPFYLGGVPKTLLAIVRTLPANAQTPLDGDATPPPAQRVHDKIHNHYQFLLVSHFSMKTQTHEIYLRNLVIDKQWFVIL